MVTFKDSKTSFSHNRTSASLVVCPVIKYKTFPRTREWIFQSRPWASKSCCRSVAAAFEAYPPPAASLREIASTEPSAQTLSTRSVACEREATKAVDHTLQMGGAGEADAVGAASPPPSAAEMMVFAVCASEDAAEWPAQSCLKDSHVPF